MTGPRQVSDAEAQLARIARRRGIALDVAGMLLAVGGLATLVVVLIMLLGWTPAVLLVAAALGLGGGVAIMRREHTVPAVLVPQPKPSRGPTGPDEDTAPGQSYAPARSIDDGAPRSPITGM